MTFAYESLFVANSTKSWVYFCPNSIPDV